jgi:hypothetical protein
VRIISWKSSIHHMDPLGTTTRTYNGSFVRTTSGHRDVGSTACPGLIRNNMWWIRTEAANATSWTSGEPNGRPPYAPEPEPSPEPSPSPTATPDEPAPLPDEERFLDVTAAAHRENVLTAHDANVLLGYTDNTFRPDRALNRGDMARAVARGMGLKENPNWRNYFPDDADYQSKPWLGPWIAALVDVGVVSGYADGTFRPGESLRRDQMATFLARALRLPEADPTFTDVPRSSAHARRIGAVQKAGVTTGITATEYGPGLTMRRDQSATLLVRAFDLRR